MASKPARRNRGSECLDARGLRDRLRADLDRLGLASGRIESVARQLEPMLPSLSVDEYSAVLAGVAAVTSRAESVAAESASALDIADVERLMHGVREEVQKLDEGLRMLSAYVTGLRRSSHRRVDERLH